MAAIIINEDLLDEMLERYYNQNLGTQGPSITEIVGESLKKLPNGQEYDLEKSCKIYNHVLEDYEVIQFYPPSFNGRGEAYYRITSKGRGIHNSGGLKKHFIDEKEKKENEELFKYRELVAAERSAESTKSASNAAWIAGFFAAFSFLYPLYEEYTRPKPLEAVDVRQTPLEIEMLNLESPPKQILSGDTANDFSIKRKF